MTTLPTGTAMQVGMLEVDRAYALAATSAEEQQAATSQDYPMFSQPMTSDEALGMLKGSGEVVDASRAYSS